MDPDHRKEISSRLKLRRQFAQGAMLLVFSIVIATIWCLSEDSLAARFEKIGPSMAVMFGTLIVKLCYYFKIGSDETRAMLDKDKAP